MHSCHVFAVAVVNISSLYVCCFATMQNPFAMLLFLVRKWGPLYNVHALITPIILGIQEKRKTVTEETVNLFLTLRPLISKLFS